MNIEKLSNILTLDYLCCILMMNCAGIRLIVCVWFALIRRTKHNKHSICGWESMLFVYLSIRATDKLISLPPMQYAVVP